MQNPTPQLAPETWTVGNLRLTRVDAADMADLVRLGADPRVGATLGGVRSPAETHTQLARFQAHWQEHGFGVWAVRQGTTGDFVGRAGFLHTPLTDPTFTIHTVGLLYAIAPEFWGRGYARAIATALVTLALDGLQLPEISGWTLITNARSQRVLAHAGLHYERRLTHWNLPHVFYRRYNHCTRPIAPARSHPPDRTRPIAPKLADLMANNSESNLNQTRIKPGSAPDQTRISPGSNPDHHRDKTSLKFRGAPSFEVPYPSKCPVL